ncbi:ImmA/IrrE family metallo-endopeptidase [Nitrobacter winogradskyi]|nr:ImmA/IrrE family metallo-endopeptidase [Nitrobacter winogradskyi]
MAIEDVGLNPQRLAEAIHDQLAKIDGAVPIYEIAAALDIDEVREQPLCNLEAALVTTPERDRGSILLNSRSNRQRRRFSLSHELLHFLNPTHEQISIDGFRCTRQDMRLSSGDRIADRHRRQESEANSFAIELLTPRYRLKPFLRGATDLAHVVAMAKEFDISREAAARRFVELHPEDLAAVFCKDSRFVYAACGRDFPRLSITAGEQCDLGQAVQGTISSFDEVAPDDWLHAAQPACELSAQTLWQANGRSITLLRARQSDDDGPGFDDTFERFTGGLSR